MLPMLRNKLDLIDQTWS